MNNDKNLELQKLKCRFLKEFNYYRTKRYITINDYMHWTYILKKWRYSKSNKNY